MALFQYPCPEEIDVFSGPHSRMRQLVYEAFEKLSATNFKDDVSLFGFLDYIDPIFQELKHHEEIENMCIMTALQRRLINEQIQAIVNDVHKDKHVLEILSLTRRGLKCASKERPCLNRRGFEDRLKTALASFRRDFVPHMRHEEEVFQPLLMEYFTFEELKEIKARVLHLHSAFSDHESNQHSVTVTENKKTKDNDTSGYKTEKNGVFEKRSVERTKLNVIAKDLENQHVKASSDSSCNNISPRTSDSKLVTNISLGKEQPLLVTFPSEISLKIFSYLGPKDLLRCAQVCQLWSHAARDGVLWRELYPVRWIFNNDWRFGADEDELCSCDSDSDVQTALPEFSSSSLAGTGADAIENEDAESVMGTGSSDETPSEMRQLLGMVRYLLPLVGPSVWVLKLGCCPTLSNGLAFKILSHCPNLKQLDLSQTAVSDLGLNGLFRKASRIQLQHLDVSGCRNITDKTLFKLSSSLGKLPTGSSVSDIEDSGCGCHTVCSCGQRHYIIPQTFKRELVYLGLSGCYQITDAGLRALAKYGGLPKLQHLDLSGCLNVTAEGLLDLVIMCPSLDHTQFFYCDNIDEGPYPDTASGCQNLECKNRVCCRSGK